MSDDTLAKSPQDRLSALKARSKGRVKELERKLGRPLTSAPRLRVVYVALDCSGSMADMGKLRMAKAGANEFADDALKKGYRVGLISFDSTALCAMEAQQVQGLINTHLNKLEARGSTNMAAAINLARALLTMNTGERVIMIVTDGMPDDHDMTLQSAKDAKLAGIDIMTLGTDDADRTFLELLASRKELSTKVARQHLQEGIASMAKLLPGASARESEST